MRNLLLKILLELSIVSCTNLVSNNSISTATAKLEPQDNSIDPSNTTKIQVNSNFPFGCEDLKKIKFPCNWEGDTENYGHLEKPFSQVFEDIAKCFYSINSVKIIESLRPDKLELLEIGSIFKTDNNVDICMRMSIDSCRYRLPNMANYECYYSYHRFGNLILLNPQTHDAKLLTIYADDLGGEGYTLLRYFFIENNEISIYETTCYDDGCRMVENYKIIIQSDGQIIIDNLNNNAE